MDRLPAVDLRNVRARFDDFSQTNTFDVVPSPYNLPRIGSWRVGSPESPGVCPPRPDNISTEGSIGPISFRISGTPFSSVESRRLASPVVVNADRNETADGRNIVIVQANPRRGPMTGGTEIWIWGSGFPTDLMPLYARFGDNVTRVVGVLSLLLKKPDHF